MLKIFGKKKEPKEKPPELVDLDNNNLKEGDLVLSLRYDLGKCRIIQEEGVYYYQSIKSGEKVTWLKMIDAATQKQKVHLQKGP